MSITNATSSSVSQLQQFQQRRPPGPGKEIREGIDQLKTALQSNDLEAAQKAYESLSELNSKRQSSTTSSSTTDSTGTGKDPLSTMLSEVGTALKTGDVSQVQQAFAEFGPPQGGPGGAGGRGGPPPGPPPGGQGPSDEVKQAMGQLSQSLGSGDLSAAQTAYESLSSLLGGDEDDTTTSVTAGTSATGTATTSAADRFKEMLGDLGSALQTGHLATAQSLFSSLAPRGSQGVDLMA